VISFLERLAPRGPPIGLDDTSVAGNHNAPYVYARTQVPPEHPSNTARQLTKGSPRGASRARSFKQHQRVREVCFGYKSAPFSWVGADEPDSMVNHATAWALGRPIPSWGIGLVSF